MGQPQSIPIKGDTGPFGPKGDKGDIGPKGDKGDKGDIGPAGGPKGDKGNTGDKGDTGDKGTTGSKGDKGDKGDVGPAGPTGADPDYSKLMWFTDGTIGKSPANLFITKNVQNKADATSSEISNDTTTASVKALALYGNTSSGGKKQVKIFDDLTVAENTITDTLVANEVIIHNKNQLKFKNNASISTNNSGDIIITSSTGKQFLFGNNGTLYLPGALNVGGDIEKAGPGSVTLLNGSKVWIDNITNGKLQVNSDKNVKGTLSNVGDWETFYLNKI